MKSGVVVCGFLGCRHREGAYRKGNNGRMPQERERHLEMQKGGAESTQGRKGHNFGNRV